MTDETRFDPVYGGMLVSDLKGIAEPTVELSPSAFEEVVSRFIDAEVGRKDIRKQAGDDNRMDKLAHSLDLGLGKNFDGEQGLVIRNPDVDELHIKPIENLSTGVWNRLNRKLDKIY